MIEFTFSNTPEVVAALRSKGPRLITALSNKLTFLMLKLQRKVQVEKLQGQVLKHRTGVLSGSITMQPTRLIGTTLVGAVTGAGGPAWYGRVHELGPSGGGGPYEIRPVNKKVLAFMVEGKMRFAKLVIHPGVVKRAFMLPSQEEMRPEIISGLNEAVNSVVNNG